MTATTSPAQRLRTGLAVLLLTLLVSAPAMAGSGPSPENCEDVTVTIKCHVCSTGKYVHKFTVDGKYNASGGGCFGSNPENMRQRCYSGHNEAYDHHLDEAAFKYEYTLFSKDYSGKYPSDCKF